MRQCTVATRQQSASLGCLHGKGMHFHTCNITVQPFTFWMEVEWCVTSPNLSVKCPEGQHFTKTSGEWNGRSQDMQWNCYKEGSRERSDIISIRNHPTQFLSLHNTCHLIRADYTMSLQPVLNLWVSIPWESRKEKAFKHRRVSVPEKFIKETLRIRWVSHFIRWETMWRVWMLTHR